MNKAEVMHLLQPLMGKSFEPKGDEKPSSSRVAPYKQQSPSKGKGKSKGKNKASPKMPHVLLNGGCRAMTNSGDSICYGFNLGTCSNKVTNGRCGTVAFTCVHSRSAASTMLSSTALPRTNPVDYLPKARVRSLVNCKVQHHRKLRITKVMLTHSNPKWS